LNQDFAVHWDEPANYAFGWLPIEVGTGLAVTTVEGKRNGQTYVYRCQSPKLVHDRLQSCGGGPDTFYRIPFLGPFAPGFLNGWNVSQGNNGTFTHKGDQKYAFDFPATPGLPVLAARGGKVVFVRNSSSSSCWNPNANNGQGACENCTGSFSANMVTILHDDGTQGRYFHFKKGSVQVSVGQRIYRGDFLAEIGTTGCSTGNHVHFDVTENSNSNVTLPIRFEAFNAGLNFQPCYLPPSNSSGFSNNKPWNWPF
jgi:hypothetical protein